MITPCNSCSTCCATDPENLIYRKELRQTQRAKFENNGIGQTLASLRSLLSQFCLRRAMMKERYLDGAGTGGIDPDARIRGISLPIF